VRLDRGEVHVWSVELRSDGRRERRAEAGRALRRVLGGYLDRDPGQIELRAGSAGKPALVAPFQPLRFNLSHSGRLALVAVARDREVGIDVEDMSRPRDFSRLARRWLGPRVATEIEATPRHDRAAAFYAAWTRHEAAGKCLGSGLSEKQRRPLPAVALDVGPAHAAALAAAALRQRVPYSLNPALSWVGGIPSEPTFTFVSR
jgi:4'-phosphopantetheinyl transferase